MMEFEFEQLEAELETEAVKDAAEGAEVLVEIAVDKLYPHPDNPRRDLGDLSELVESVRERGILQNLTVVRHPFADKEEYTVVIGHRRLEAAKRAGLATVPCRVTYMSEREMIATMLLENMQRSDLTPLEEAEGMQMMMDLGETVNTISKKTGLSESTVRRRTRLTKLDREKLKAASAERQITFTELDKLFEIEDEEKRNKVLESIGTRNFDQQLSAAKEEERVERARRRATAIFESLGIKKIAAERKWQDYDHVDYVDGTDENLETALREYQKEYGELYYEVCYSTKLRIWTPERDEEEADETSLSPEEIAKREREEKKKAKITELRDKFTAIFELRREWAENYTPTSARRDISKIASYLIKRAWAPYYGGYYDKDLLVKLADPTLKIDPDVKDKFGVIRDDVERLPEYYLFLHVYVSLVDGQRCCFDSYKEAYQKNDGLAEIYAFLSDLGYEMSDEEITLLNGKHPIYGEIAALANEE